MSLSLPALAALLVLGLATAACDDGTGASEGPPPAVDEARFIQARAEAFTAFDSGHKRALELLHELNAMRPGLYGVNRRLGQLYTEMKQHVEGLQHYLVALTAKPEDAETRLAAVNLALRLDRPAKARELLPPLLEHASFRGEGLYLLAALEHEAGHLDEAYAALEQTRGLSPEQSWRGAALHGLLLAEDGRHEDAVERFEFALRGRPDAKEALAGMARSCYRLDRNEDAAHYEHIHRLIMDLTDDVYMKSRKRTTERLAALATIVADYPRWIDGFRQLADLQVSEGLAAEACATIRRLLDVHGASIPREAQRGLLTQYCDTP